MSTIQHNVSGKESQVEYVPNDIPESPSQLQVTPQENYSSVKNQQQNHTQPAVNRCASQGSFNRSFKQSKLQVKKLNLFLESNGKGRTKSSAKSVQSNTQESATPQKRTVFSPAKSNLEAFEEKLNTDHLKSAITALNEKLKFYENIEQERQNLQEQLDQSDQARDELRNNIRENAERIKEEKEKNIKYQEILINENQSLSKQILIITEMFSKKVEEFDEIKQNLADKEKELNTANLDRANLRDYHDKYQREFAQREDLQMKYIKMNQLLES